MLGIALQTDRRGPGKSLVGKPLVGGLDVEGAIDLGLEEITLSPGRVHVNSRA